jgi:hypothetical protein
MADIPGTAETVETRLAAIREEQIAQRRGLTFILENQKIHGDMLERILIAVTAPPSGESPLERLLLDLIRAIQENAVLINRVLDVPPRDSRLAEILDGLGRAHGIALVSRGGSGGDGPC